MPDFGDIPGLYQADKTLQQNMQVILLQIGQDLMDMNLDFQHIALM